MTHVSVIDAKPTVATEPDVNLFQRQSRRGKRQPLLTRDTGLAALKQALVMLRPDLQWNNPVASCTSK